MLVSSMSSKVLCRFKILLSHCIPFIRTQKQKCDLKINVAGPASTWLQSSSEQDCGEVSGTSEPGENSTTAIAAPQLTFAYKLLQLPAAQTRPSPRHRLQSSNSSILTRFFSQCISPEQLPYSSDT